MPRHRRGDRPDALEQVKKGLKRLFKKKEKKDTAKPTATTEAAAGPADAKPTETTPAAPAPADAPKTEAAPAAPAAPAAAPVPAEGEAKKEEAPTTEVKEPTASRFSSASTIHSSATPAPDGFDGSRWRQKVAVDKIDKTSRA
jgi:hypothetical protein